MQLRRSKRAWWEYFVFGICIFSSVIMAMAISHKRDHLHKSRLLILELETIRSQILTSFLLSKKYPKTLEEAGVNLREDPFGNPYHFHSQNGWASTSTPGFEGW